MSTARSVARPRRAAAMVAVLALVLMSAACRAEAEPTTGVGGETVTADADTGATLRSGDADRATDAENDRGSDDTGGTDADTDAVEAETGPELDGEIDTEVDTEQEDAVDVGTDSASTGVADGSESVLSEEEIAELEADLDEIDQLLRDMESAFAGD